MKKPAIYRLVFPSQYYMAASLMRLQEYYEGPRLAGKIFSVEQVCDDYAVTTKGEMSYYTDWGGFNFPGYVASAFFGESGFAPYLKKELLVKSAISDFLRTDQELCYFVSSSPEETGNTTLLHEIVHGLYYLNHDYRLEVDSIVSADKQHRPFERKLLKNGYAPHVISDEINAYLLTGLGFYDCAEFRKSMAPLRRALLKLFTKHHGTRLSTVDGRKATCKFIRKTIRLKPSFLKEPKPRVCTKCNGELVEKSKSRSGYNWCGACDGTGKYKENNRKM